MPQNLGEAAYGQMPKDESVAVSYASMDTWGSVYYGKDTVTYQKVFNRLPDVRSAVTKVLNLETLDSSIDIIQGLVADEGGSLEAVLGVFGNDEGAESELARRKAQRIKDKNDQFEQQDLSKRLEEERHLAAVLLAEQHDRKTREEQDQFAAEADRDEQLEVRLGRRAHRSMLYIYAYTRTHLLVRAYVHTHLQM
jgi:hypothetical protein